MTPQKHAPELVEAAKQCLLSEDSFLTCTERDMLIAARKGKDCSSVGNARWVLLNHIAALTEENAQLVQEWKDVQRDLAAANEWVRALEAQRDFRSCTICGLTVDVKQGHVAPSGDFTTKGRVKSIPNDPQYGWPLPEGPTA